MGRYRTIVLLVIFGFAPLLVAVFAARFLMVDDPAPPAKAQQTATAKPPPEEKSRRKILAAARRLPVGVLVGEGDLTALEVARGEIRPAHVILDGKSGVTGFFGHAMREAAEAGSPLTWASLVGPGQRGFLAAVLRPGMRAVTIQLGKGIRHAGLIDPGDRVDVILTAEVPAAGKRKAMMSTTILEDVRVVAVDRLIEIGVPPVKTDEEIVRTKIVTATLEVTPIQANRLVLGEREGKLSLAVRSLAAAGVPGTGGKPVVNGSPFLPKPILRPVGITGVTGANRATIHELEPMGRPPVRKVVRVIRGDKDIEEPFSDKREPGPPDSGTRP